MAAMTKSPVGGRAEFSYSGVPYPYTNFADSMTGGKHLLSYDVAENGVPYRITREVTFDKGVPFHVIGQTFVHYVHYSECRDNRGGKFVQSPYQVEARYFPLVSKVKILSAAEKMALAVAPVQAQVAALAAKVDAVSTAGAASASANEQSAVTAAELKAQLAAVQADLQRLLAMPY